MGRVTALTIMGIAVVVSVFGVAPAIQAQATCTNASLSGTYGFSVRGFFQGTPVPSTTASNPIASVGTTTFDGAGGWASNYTESINGTLSTVSHAGTYAVGSNCIGTLTVTSGGTGTRSLVIHSQTNEAFVLNTTPGVVLAGILKKQTVTGCTNATLRSRYGFISEGFDQNVGGSIVTPASQPAAAIGNLVFNGAGAFSFAVTRSENGIILSGTGTGTYALLADCTGSGTATISGGATDTFNAVVISAREIFFILTVSGQVESGRAVRR